MEILSKIILGHLITFWNDIITRKVIANTILALQLISILIGLVLYREIKKNNIIEITYDWIGVEGITIPLSFIIDSFTIMFILLISTITFLVMLYSIAYLGEDPFLAKFLSFLGIFCVAMLWLCVANNLVTLFIGWEGVGLASFLLISFWSTRNEANIAALKAVFINRIGDVFLLFAIILTIMKLQASDINLINLLVPTTTNEINSTQIIVLFFCLAAAAKSAQLILHVWLPDAMEGPTPVSSLLHSATMVTAGVFLIIKLYCLIATNTEICYIFALLGLLTAILSAIFGTFQYDIKKIIAYSTCSQLGLLYFTSILGTLFAASYHLITHAFFKCLLFLCSGVIIHGHSNEQDIRKMGAFFKKFPLIYLIFSLGTLSLIGFIFMSGYYSKEFLLETLFSTGTVGLFIFIFATLGVFFSAFYSGRVIYLTFIKSRVSFAKNCLFVEGDTFMYSALFILTIMSIWAGHWFFFSFSNYFWNDTLTLTFYISLLEFELNSSFFLQHVPLILSFFGFILGITFFATFSFTSLSFLTSFYLLSSSFILKLYFDFVYSYFVSRITIILGFVQYFILDRGFFEISFFIFNLLYKNLFKIFRFFFPVLLLLLLFIFFAKTDPLYVNLYAIAAAGFVGGDEYTRAFTEATSNCDSYADQPAADRAYSLAYQDARNETRYCPENFKELYNALYIAYHKMFLEKFTQAYYISIFDAFVQAPAKAKIFTLAPTIEKHPAVYKASLMTDDDFERIFKDPDVVSARQKIYLRQKQDQEQAMEYAMSNCDSYADQPADHRAYIRASQDARNETRYCPENFKELYNALYTAYRKMFLEKFTAAYCISIFDAFVQAPAKANIFTLATTIEKHPAVRKAAFMTEADFKRIFKDPDVVSARQKIYLRQAWKSQAAATTNIHKRKNKNQKIVNKPKNNKK